MVPLDIEKTAELNDPSDCPCTGTQYPSAGERCESSERRFREHRRKVDKQALKRRGLIYHFCPFRVGSASQRGHIFESNVKNMANGRLASVI